MLPQISLIQNEHCARIHEVLRGSRNCRIHEMQDEVRPLHLPPRALDSGALDLIDATVAAGAAPAAAAPVRAATPAAEVPVAAAAPRTAMAAPRSPATGAARTPSAPATSAPALARPAKPSAPPAAPSGDNADDWESF